MYTARISRTNPTLFVVLIDQSGSMEELTLFNGELIPKSEAVSLIVNMLIAELLNRSRREEGHRDYFEMAVLGYHGTQVESLLGDGKHPLMRSSQLAGRERRTVKLHKKRLLPDGRAFLAAVDQRIWVEPFAAEQTPMYAALLESYALVKKWCASKAHREAYPPTIFNITDGEASDGDENQLIEIAQRIQALGTEDGAALLFNIHISSNTTDQPILFACSPQELPDQRYARQLFAMSSPMPQAYHEHIVALRSAAGEASPETTFRGISYNAAMTDLIGMMNIGSVSVSLLG